jgi:hypothetical protein
MSHQTLSGSCLCGSLKYSVSGVPSRFYHCHCTRCRKSSGTGHATNLFMTDGKITWTGDTELIKRYKVPEAERFTRTFCSNCGCALPVEIAAMNLAFIPAGTLDDEPNIKPQARIFQDSRTSWSCGNDDMTCFENYPS